MIAENKLPCSTIDEKKKNLFFLFDNTLDVLEERKRRRLLAGEFSRSLSVIFFDEMNRTQHESQWKCRFIFKPIEHEQREREREKRRKNDRCVSVEIIPNYFSLKDTRSLTSIYSNSKKKKSSTADHYHHWSNLEKKKLDNLLANWSLVFIFYSSSMNRQP